MDTKRETELLLCHVLKKNRAYLLAHPELQLTEAEQAKFDALWKRREAGEPIAYILGKQGFWKHEFSVTPDTLIPRPETELLIETTLQRLDTSKPARILDLGTGSGIIAISLALESPYWQVIGADQSEAALAVARTNARNLLALNVSFLQSDWFHGLDSRLRGNDKTGEQDEGLLFDLIVANPPYIAENDSHLTQGDLRFEPKSALAAGKDGLKDLRTIIYEAPHFLKPGGLLMVEHGYNQAEAVQALLQQAKFSKIETLADLNQHPRISLGYRL